MRRRGLRWAPPVVAAAAVAAYAVVPAATAAVAAHPALPATTAGHLLRLVADARVPGLSGDVQEVADLGLPALPAGTGNALTTLLAGTHDLSLAVAPGRLRLAIRGRLSEQDLVLDGTAVRTYDSKTGRATAATLPTADALTPPAVAQRAIAAVGPDTDVTVGSTARLAGRDAYTLVLTPHDRQTLIGRVEVAVDAATGFPLRVAIYPARSSAAAFSTAFTTLSYTVPPPSTFDLGAAPPPTSGPAVASPPTSSSRGGTLGAGWSTVLRIAGLRLTPAQARQLAEVSTAVPQGRLVTTRLLSLLVTPAGVVYLGAVPRAVLVQDAGR